MPPRAAGWTDPAADLLLHARGRLQVWLESRPADRRGLAAGQLAALVKSLLLAAAAGFTARRFRRVSLLLLVGVVLFYQVVGSAGEWALSGSLTAALQDFRIGIPGMLLQIFGGYLLIKYLK